MNAQEREKLARFLQQLAQAQTGPKDLEAERLIADACRSQPDAYYLLVQRNLLLEQAVENAQAEIARLRSEQSAAPAGGGFLDSNAWGGRPAPAPAFTRTPAYAAAPASSPPAATAPAQSSFFSSGLLGNVATTAAGVVAGSFLFQGIEHLMGNHGSNSGFLPGANALAPEALTENVVVNNDHDSPGSSIDDADSFSGDGDVDWV
ncbi:DUF2076 domain-containing protein [Rhodocyclus tenuis]|uniref:DUF2076 family protein n=1 Tax=Rhodocyclus tenuis TaxID=1066 RepID=A0A840FZP2_RHOTE|nr:DUF2076 family protein [Rhodocyclus tenuis]MBB4245693.1 hypothetical protein [Rhodocyclus tenuis]